MGTGDDLQFVLVYTVQDCVKARTELVEGLEKLLASSRQALEADESQLDELQKRKIKVETTRQGVEFAIMGGKDLSGGMNGQPAPEPDRPEMEALTPPSVKDEDEPDVKPPKKASPQKKAAAPRNSSAKAPPQADDEKPVKKEETKKPSKSVRECSRWKLC